MKGINPFYLLVSKVFATFLQLVPQIVNFIPKLLVFLLTCIALLLQRLSMLLPLASHVVPLVHFRFQAVDPVVQRRSFAFQVCVLVSQVADGVVCGLQLAFLFPDFRTQCILAVLGLNLFMRSAFQKKAVTYVGD